MLMVPLFHVHPEADHRHGEAGHVHGGTAHTVWSPDLDCEFASHENHEKAVSGSAQFAHSGDGHTEFGLSLLTDSTDRKHSKPLLTQALAVAHGSFADPNPSMRREQHATLVSSCIRFIHDLPSRAPPSLFV